MGAMRGAGLERSPSALPDYSCHLPEQSSI